MKSDGRRTPAPTARPVALTVAGSDSGGGAGVQADLKTMEATGAFATSVVTAVTAQNTRGVDATHVLPLDEIAAQYEAVTDDFDVRAAKTGMLATATVVERVARWTREAPFPVVVDPVMVAESGDRLLSEDAEDAYEELVAAATLVTPNTAEAAVLTGIDPETPDEQAAAGERLLEMGAGAALVTGGHAGGDTVTDVLVTPQGTATFIGPWVATDATHGSGCTLSAAVAARLATGEDLPDAVEAAVEFVGRAVRYAHDVGEGPGAVHHLVDLRNEAARERTRTAATDLADRLADLPTGGVAAATPYAEIAEDVVYAGGDGEESDAENALAETLLAARETGPDVRFAVGCSPSVRDGFGALDYPVTDHADRVASGDEPTVVLGDGVEVVGGSADAVETAVREAFDAAR